MMILRVRLEVLREVVDALAQKRDLNFRGPGVAVVCLVRPDDAALAVLAQRHCSILHERARTRAPFPRPRAPPRRYLYSPCPAHAVLVLTLVPVKTYYLKSGRWMDAKHHRPGP